MESLGNKITEQRKKQNLTQKELGDMLNVSAQAVSKWENGQAEPDASTIKKLCEIFKISTDELFGIIPPADETAAAAAEVRAQEATAPASAPQTVTEQKIINGYCERCKKPVGPNEYVIEHFGRGAGIQHIYCNECKAKMIHAHAVSERVQHKKKTVISVIVGGVTGIAVFVALALVLTLAGEAPAWFALPAAAVFGVAGLSFAMQMFWDGAVNDMFFFCFKSFKMPGVIFTLDLDGILFLIFVKLFGAILGVFLSVIFFIVGFVIVYLGSVLILPFACIKRAMETKKLKSEEEKTALNLPKAA